MIKVRQETKESKGPLALKVLPEMMEPKDLQVMMDKLVHKAHQATADLLEQMEFVDLKDLKENRVTTHSSIAEKKMTPFNE